MVQTVYDGRLSRYSAEVSATTGPARPMNPQANADTSRVDLSWEAAEGAVRYEVIEGYEEAVKGNTTTTSFSDAAVSNGSWYRYKIRAVAASGATEDSVTITVHTGVPTRTTITASPTEVGQNVLFTARVLLEEGQSMPYHGRVDFYVDGGLAGWQDNIDYRIHTAKEWMLRLPEGDHVVYAQYQGYHGSDGIFIAGSSSAIRIHVVKPAYGSVNFTGTYLYPFGENSSPKSTAIVDVSGDGRLDAVATTGTHTGDAEDFQLYTFLQQSQPDQTLTWGTIWSSHGAWRSAMRIATGDVNSDGDSDIGVTATAGSI